MFCSKCGAQLDDKSYYCQSCGHEVNKPYTQQPFNMNNNTGQTYQSGYSQQQYTNNINPAAMSSIQSKIDDARTMGILAIVLGLICSALVGICLGIVGISKLNSIQTFNTYIPEIEMQKEKTRKLNLIGIILPLVLRILLVVFYFIFIFAMVGTIAEY